MRFRVLAVFGLCVFSFVDFTSAYRVRIKRQDVSNSEPNLKIALLNNCSCVQHYQCDKDGFIITNGQGIFEVVAVVFFCFSSFGDFLRFTRVRTKRQKVPPSDQNLEIEFFNNCSCVYEYQCDKENFVITNGQGLTDNRVGQSKAKRIPCIGGEFEGEYTCCKHKPGEENKPPVTLPNPLPGTIFNRTGLVPAKRTCGTQLPNINVRIFGDENELIPVDGEFPWLVAIFKKSAETPEWKFHASGSLIHPRVILTANHVVVSAHTTSLKVIANGRIELSKIGDKPLQERNVKEIIKHPDYNSGMLLNDVALLVLEEPYKTTSTPYINTLCLQPNMSFETKRCLVAGWGRTENSDGSAQVLKKVELPTLSHSKCQQLLAKALGKSDYIFHESLLCAGGEQGKDACKGDGGSPLMCPTGANNAMYQVGIVAWGIGCGKKDVPGAYANVQFLHNWIVDKLKQQGLEL